jgi:hypothetical protein
MKNVQQAVDEIDLAKMQYFERNPDRPQGRLRMSGRKPIEIKKAESRVRTAAWRKQNDGRKRPEAYHCAIQFLDSVMVVIRATGREGLEDLRETEQAFQHALATLERRGYDKEQARAVFKRLMRRNKESDADLR